MNVYRVYFKHLGKKQMQSPPYTIIKLPNNEQPKVHAIVTVENKEGAEQAIIKLNGCMFKDRAISVDLFGSKAKGT